MLKNEIDRDKVLGLLKKLFGSVNNEPRPVKYFEIPVKMRVTRGPKYGEEYVFYYGPRKIGSDSVDTDLGQDSLPACAFVVSSDLSNLPIIRIVDDRTRSERTIDK